MDIEEFKRRRELVTYVHGLQPAGQPTAADDNAVGAPTRYAVLTAPEPCECCGVTVVLLQRHDRPRPIWYQIGRPRVVAGGRVVDFLLHDAERCRGGAQDDALLYAE